MPKRNNLSLKQSMALVEWFKGQTSRIKANKWTAATAAEHAAHALGFTVTDHNLMGIAGQRDGVLIKFDWPNNRGGQSGANKTARAGLEARLNITIRMVERVRQAFPDLLDGEPELAREWEIITNGL